MINRKTEMNLFQLQGLVEDKTLKNLLYGVYSLVEKYITVRHSIAARDTKESILTWYALIINSKILEDYVDRIDGQEAIVIGKLIMDITSDILEEQEGANGQKETK